MEKIVHKLTKNSRREIVTNYINAKFSKELTEMNELADSISQHLISKVIDNFGEEKFNDLIETMNKLNYSGKIISKGLVTRTIKQGKKHYTMSDKQLSFELFKMNKFVYLSKGDYSYLTNTQADNESIYYDDFISRTDYEDMYKLKRLYDNLYSEMNRKDYECYELLKKVRTAELLMKHWSEAHKYLPTDIEIDEPDTLTLSEKFAML